MANLDERYDYIPPNENRRPRHEKVREAIKDCARVIDDLVPPSRENSLVHTKLEEAMFWANAGVARNVL